MSCARYAFDQPLEVINFPLRKRSSAELAELSAVHAVRRMEVVEARALAPQQQETPAGTAAAAEDGSTLYGPLELFTSVRRRNQIILLRDHM